MYDSDLPDLSIDYDEIGNFNYDANSNYYTSDSSFDSYSDSYARFKGLQPDYKPDDGVTDRSSTLREVIHKFTRDNSDHCSKGTCLCEMIDQNQIQLAYETETCYTDKSGPVPVNR